MARRISVAAKAGACGVALALGVLWWRGKGASLPTGESWPVPQLEVEKSSGSDTAVDAAQNQTALRERTRPDFIRGKALLFKADVPQDGVVVAWPESMLPSLSDFRDRNGISVSEIERDGSFLLEGLEGASYVVTAIASGAICMLPVRAEVGEANLILDLSFLYGLTIQLADVEGGPLRTDPSLYGDGPHVHGKEGHPLGRVPLELAILDIAGLSFAPLSRDRWEYMFVTHQAQRDEFPIQYRVSVPGYAPVSKVLNARPVERSLSSETVLLESYGSRDRGSVELHCVGGTELFYGQEDLGARVGTVYLVDDDNNAMLFAVNELDLLVPKRINDVPVGEYRFVYESDAGYFISPEVRVFVGTGLARLDLDLTRSGSLVIQPVVDGRKYFGTVLFAEFSDSSGSNFYLGKQQAPVELPVLPPGELVLKSLEIPGAESRELPLRLTVNSEKVTTQIIDFQMRN